MTHDEYARWMDRHAALFGMMRQEDAVMFAQWRVEFESMGFTAGELNMATDYLSREASGVTRWDHLQAIRDFIRRRRSDASSRERRLVENDPRGQCTLCSDTGRICGLPHLSQVGPDGWAPLVTGVPPLTMAAICHCIAGKWQVDAWHERSAEFKKNYPLMMKIQQYQSRNSQWQAQLRELAELQSAKRASDELTRQADKKARPASKRGMDSMTNIVPQAMAKVSVKAPLALPSGGDLDVIPMYPADGEP